MTRHLPRVVCALLLVLASMPTLGNGVHAAGKPLVVIVGASSPLKDISVPLLRRAFLNETAEYAFGKRLIPINHPPASPMREQFDRAILGLRPEEVGRFWIDRRIRDQPPPPRTAPSVELAVRIVMMLPGVISYATQDLVNDKVRVLTIEGKAPGQPGYPLQ